MRREYNSISSGVLPAGYAECEYIESTGTQYISLNFRTTSSMIFNIVVNVNDTTITQGLFQSGKDSSRQMIIITSGHYDYAMGSGYKSLNVQQDDVAPNMLLDITVTYSSVTINGHSYRIIGSPNIISNFQNINLFALNFTDSQQPISSNAFFVGKCRRFSIETNGKKIVEVIPALRLSDNKPGMYDLSGSICSLTDTPFYVNAGTGEFLYQLKS